MAKWDAKHCSFFPWDHADNGITLENKFVFFFLKKKRENVNILLFLVDI